MGRWEVGPGKEAAPAWDSMLLTWGATGHSVRDPPHIGVIHGGGGMSRGYGHDVDKQGC